MPDQCIPIFHESAIPIGYCQCGCGQETLPYDEDEPERGGVKGQPRKFVLHHSRALNQLPALDCGEYFKIPLHSRKYKDLYAVVDPQDFELVRAYRWSPMDNPAGGIYAVTEIYRNGVRGGRLWMHRMIAGTPDHLFTDHINGNTLDNRRPNLRTATKSLNGFNRPKRAGSSSRFLGVHLVKGTSRWIASVTMDGKSLNVGRFDSEVDAAMARDEFVRGTDFASFARYNFPHEGEQPALEAYARRVNVARGLGGVQG